MLFFHCRGSLYKLLHRSGAKEVLDERRRLNMAFDVVLWPPVSSTALPHVMELKQYNVTIWALCAGFTGQRNELPASTQPSYCSSWSEVSKSSSWQEVYCQSMVNEPHILLHLSKQNCISMLSAMFFFLKLRRRAACHFIKVEKEYTSLVRPYLSTRTPQTHTHLTKTDAPQKYMEVDQSLPYTLKVGSLTKSS